MSDKPGLFRSYGEAMVKLSLAVVFIACIGALALWAMGALHFERG
jgi:hypothetical protein